MLGTTAENAQNVALYIMPAIMLYVDLHTVLYKVPSNLNVMLEVSTTFYHLLIQKSCDVAECLCHP
jgi:hypothetical protein